MTDNINCIQSDTDSIKFEGPFSTYHIQYWYKNTLVFEIELENGTTLQPSSYMIWDRIIFLPPERKLDK